MITEAQRAARMEGLGSSDAPRVIAAPFDVYLMKTGQAQVPQTLRMRMGNNLEAGISQTVADLTGWTLTERDTQRHPDVPWMFTHVDRWVEELGCPLEIKLVGFGRQHEWGEPGTDQVPEKVIWQVTHQMVVTGASECRVAAAIGTDLHLYRVRLDADVAAFLVEQERVLWEEHIAPRIEPSAAGSSLAVDWVRERFPRDAQPLRRGSVLEADLAREYHRLCTDLKTLEESAKAARIRLCQAIGDSEGFYLNGVRATWKADVNGKRTLRVSVKEQ